MKNILIHGLGQDNQSWKNTNMYLKEKEERMKESQWILCPICNNKTRIKVREDTELKNFPLYCPKCKKESLIEVKKLKTKKVVEPDA